MIESQRPLEGVKCVCAIILQQLPVAFTLMADLGAEVIKIERPGTGESARWTELVPVIPGQTLSPYFETHNRGFKSLTLDIQKRKGLEILYRLVKDADILHMKTCRKLILELYISQVQPMDRTGQMLYCREPMRLPRPLVVSPVSMGKRGHV